MMAPLDGGIADPPLYALYLHEPMLRGLLTTLGHKDLVDGPFGSDAGHQALFHLLENAVADGVLRTAESTSDLEGLRPGELVEVFGITHGNLLMTVLNFVATVMPLIDEPRDPGRARPGRPSLGGPANDAEQQVQRIVTGVVAAANRDLRCGPVVDVVMATASDLPVVLTLDRAILGASGEALLQDRHVRVIGKVSSVLSPEQPVNLFRHSVLAATSPEVSRQMLAELSDDGLQIDLADPIVEGPGLEILPLAVLI